MRIPFASLLLLSLVACGQDADAPNAPSIDASPSCGPIVGVPEAPPECPAQVQSCGVGDLGWNAWCEGGTVFVDDLTTYHYCRCGTQETACTLGGAGAAREVHTCTAGCVDADVHYLETFQEFQQFQPASLCVAVDAGAS